MELKFVNCLVVLMCLTCTLEAQNLDKLEKKAEKEFYAEDLESALETYNEILRIRGNHQLARYRAEICSLLTKYRDKSLQNLIDFGSSQGRKDKFYNYWLGKAHFRQDHFTKAVESWNKFLKLKKFKSKIIIGETKGLIERALLAHEQYSHPDNYEVEHLHNNVNSKYSEYSPVYFQDKEELLFLSSRPQNKLKSKHGNFHVYHSYRDGNEWANPTMIGRFGTFEEGNANIEVVNNDGRLFVYKEKRGGELYYSEYQNDEWSDLIEFDARITQSKLESHFYINEKEDRVLFAARTKGKPGDLDIFESYKDPSTGKWSKPEDLGNIVNSEFDEDYPSLSIDEKTLYFSTKGFESMGGYDVYKSEWNEKSGKWSKPESLKYPVNTPNDDIQFKLDKDQSSGYFVSDRYGSNGGFDVFFFHTSEKVQLEGIVVDNNGNTVELAEIHFIPKRKTGLLVKTMTDDKGQYKAKISGNDQITVEISIDHELVFSDRIETPKVGAFPLHMHKDFTIQTDKKAVKVAIYDLEDPEYTDLENITNKFRHSNKALLGNIYFDFAQYEINGDGRALLNDLTKTLKTNKDLRIQISGHTDNFGTEEVNMLVSQKRAEVVKRFLMLRGIDEGRLVAKGYGETRPVGSNEDAQGRFLNRRIEVVVLE